jgi:hypothetical protein
MKVRQPFLNFENCPFKSCDFSNKGALDVKPVSLIAGFCGFPFNSEPKKQFNHKAKPKNAKSLPISIYFEKV